MPCETIFFAPELYFWNFSDMKTSVNCDDVRKKESIMQQTNMHISVGQRLRLQK